MPDFSKFTIPLAKAGRERGISPVTMHRWAFKGCRGVVLESVLIGGRRYVSADSLTNFFAALNSDAIAAPTSPTPDADGAAREAAIARAEAELETAGA